MFTKTGPLFSENVSVGFFFGLTVTDENNIMNQSELEVSSGGKRARASPD